MRSSRPPRSLSPAIPSATFRTPSRRPASARAGKAVAMLAAVLCATFALVLIAPRLLGLTPFAVLSGSMEPTYPVGSLIYVQNAEGAQVQEGDAVTFVADERGTVATHRVVAVDGAAGLLRTQGDANAVPDGQPVPFANVIGRPVVCIPGVGYAVSWLTQPPGSFLAVGCVVVLFAWAFAPLARRGGTGRKSETKGTTR